MQRTTNIAPQRNGHTDAWRNHPAPQRWAARLTGLAYEPGRIPAAIILPARLFLGITYLYAGLQKFTDPQFFTPSASGFIGQQMRDFVSGGSPISGILIHVAIPHATFVGAFIAFAELLVGLSALLGLMTRLGAVGGVTISLLFYLTASWPVHPYFLGGDLPYALVWLTLLLAGPGPFSLDEYFFGAIVRTAPTNMPRTPRRAAHRSPAHHEPARPPITYPTETMTRGAFLRGFGTTIIVIAAAGVTAAIAKFRTPDQTTDAITATQPAPAPATTITQPSPTTGTTAKNPPSFPLIIGSGTATSDNPVTAAPPLPRATPSPIPATGSTGNASQSSAGSIGNVASLAVNSAKSFTDPASGNPAVLIHLQSGQFVAYSAVCTHEGCTVNYDPSRQMLVCPCHRAVFDPAHNAQGVSGPARRPLPSLPVHVDGQGNAILSGSP